MAQNVVIGNPIIPASQLLAYDEQDWEENEKDQTLFTKTRFLPAVMKEAGIVKSTGEVIRNRKDLVITLDHSDFMEIKWGKKRLFVVVGE